MTLDASTTRANQPPPLEGYDLYGANRPLAEAVAREGAGWAKAAYSVLLDRFVGVLALAMMVVMVNFAVDLLYVYLNPQIRLR